MTVRLRILLFVNDVVINMHAFSIIPCHVLKQSFIQPCSAAGNLLEQCRSITWNNRERSVAFLGAGCHMCRCLVYINYASMYYVMNDVCFCCYNHCADLAVAQILLHSATLRNLHYGCAYEFVAVQSSVWHWHRA